MLEWAAFLGSFVLSLVVVAWVTLRGIYWTRRARTLEPSRSSVTYSKQGPGKLGQETAGSHPVPANLSPGPLQMELGFYRSASNE